MNIINRMIESHDKTSKKLASIDKLIEEIVIQRDTFQVRIDNVMNLTPENANPGSEWCVSEATAYVEGYGQALDEARTILKPETTHSHGGTSK